MNRKQKLLGATLVLALSMSVPSWAEHSEAEKLNKNQKQNTRINKNVDRPYADSHRMDKFVGIDLQNQSGEKLGEIKDAIVDLESGRILYTLVSGQGIDNFAAVPPQLLSLTQDRAAYRAKITKDLLRDAPKVTRGQDNLGEVSFVSNVYKHYNQQAWWEGPNSAASRPNFGNVHRLTDLKGMKVENVQNADLGKIDNVVLDLDAGRVIFLTLATGNIINRDAFVYGVPPNALTLGTDKKVLILDADKEKLANSPKFKRDNWPDLASGIFAHSVYRHYGKQAYFDPVTPTGRPGAKPRVYQDNNK